MCVCVCVLCSGIHFANKQSSKKKGFSNLRVTIEKTLRETSNLVCLPQCRNNGNDFSFNRTGETFMFATNFPNNYNVNEIFQVCCLRIVGF